MRSDFSERYEVGTPTAGVICYCETFADAERIAKKEGPGVILYDRMAHYGARELWQVSDLGTLELVGRRSRSRETAV